MGDGKCWLCFLASRCENCFKQVVLSFNHLSLFFPFDNFYLCFSQVVDLIISFDGNVAANMPLRSLLLGLGRDRTIFQP